MSNTIRYGFKKELDLSVREAEVRVRERLKQEGFGVLTEIDVSATLKGKLDVDFRPYKILGACNPELAYGALSEETDIGLLLPCNVVVYEGGSPTASVVAVLDPRLQLAISGRSDLASLADDVTARLERVLEGL